LAGIIITENSDLEKDVLRACCHPTNRKIVELLAEENLSFTQLLSRINGSGDSGRFGYHLRRLVGFVEFEPITRKYKLTYRGKLLWGIIRDFRSRVQTGNQLLRYAEQLVMGDHAFALFDSESFKRDVTFPFLKTGLSRGYAVVYVIGEEKLNSEVLALKKQGIDLDRLPKGALTLMGSFEWQIQKGKAEAKTIITNWQKLLEEKKKVGFAGLQLITKKVTNC
jgi:hypothetical protein